MSFKLEKLPYERNSLEPYISERTVDFHYGKHHQAYVDNLNGLVEGTSDADKSLEDLIRTAGGKIYNNAAQVWNHTFYWHCMRPDGGGKPGPVLLELIDDCFGSYDDFCNQFVTVASGQFGSGWAWLVQSPDRKLEIISSADAANPISDNLRPLLTIDVWEHAYYLDYQNARGDYIKSFLEHLVNWDFVTNKLET